MDSLGHPITGKKIWIIAFQGDPCGDKTWVQDSHIDMETGNYSISLPPGDYFIQSYSDENYISEWYSILESTPSCDEAQSIQVIAKQESANKNFRLDPGAIISGVIYETDGTTPIIEKNITIDAFMGDPCGSWQWSKGIRINSDGTYSVQGLPSGNYFLQASTSDENFITEWWGYPKSTQDCSNAQSTAVTAGETSTGHDFQLDPGAIISGTVYQSDGTTPMMEQEIWVIAVQGDPCESNQKIKFALIDMLDGTYSIKGLPSGTYYLESYTEENFIREWWAPFQSTQTCSEAQAIAVSTNQEYTDKNFQLDPGAVISGRVYEGDGITPITDKYIWVDAITTDPCEGWQSVGWARINSDGTYSIKGLPLGNYYINADSYENYVAEWWADPISTPFCSSAQSIPITAYQEYPNKNFQLDIGATISGTVFESNGETPITGKYIRISVVQGDGACETTKWIDATVIDTTNGTYFFRKLAPGYYWLVSETMENYLSEWWAASGSTPSCSSAESIEVTAGQAYDNRNFQLDPAFNYYLHGAINFPENPGMAYQMIGIPIIPWDSDDIFSVLSNFFGSEANPSTWRLFKDDPSGNGYIEITQTGIDSIDYGKAWWIIASDDKWISFPGEGFSGKSFYIRVPGGYTMISNPFFNKKIDWQKIAFDPDNQYLGCYSTAFTWNSDSGNYESLVTIPPNKGIWVFTENSGELTIPKNAIIEEADSTFVSSTSKKVKTPANQSPRKAPPPPLSPGARLTLLSPNGGETYKHGKTIQIQWKEVGINPEGFSGGVNLFVSLDGGNHFKLIAKNVRGNGLFNWRIPRRMTSDQCIIRVSSVLYPVLYDVSDGTFMVQ